MEKRYFRDSSTFKALAVGFGSCLASDWITVHGKSVGLMYREAPSGDADSGWRFLAGDESEEYMADSQHFGLFDVNTIANYDPAITAHLDAPLGTALVRTGNSFTVDGEFQFPVEP
jgi:hypothetical protein